jgi:hypothetical protein
MNCCERLDRRANVACRALTAFPACLDLPAKPVPLASLVSEVRRERRAATAATDYQAFKASAARKASEAQPANMDQ